MKQTKNNKNKLITRSSTGARCVWPKSCLTRLACSERHDEAECQNIGCIYELHVGCEAMQAVLLSTVSQAALRKHVTSSVVLFACGTSYQIQTTAHV